MLQLEGIRVLDFTQYLAGPTVGRLMAELGAEVIKIEIAPGGDPSRGLPIADPMDVLLDGQPTLREYVSTHNAPACAEHLQRDPPDLIVLGGTRILEPHVFEVATVGTLNLRRSRRRRARPGLRRRRG